MDSPSNDQRRRINKRDEAIRKKVEADLERKAGKRSANDPSSPHNRPGNHHRRRARGLKAQPGTVAALRPTPALTVPHHISVADASQLCAAKRTDCVLVVDDYQRLTGIFTAKDLAFRVVAKNLDPRSTLVRDIMTPSPMVTRNTMSATDALNTMVTRGFRHLPVCNDEGDIVGLLDIAKVFYEALEKLERAYSSSQKLYNALEGVQSEWGSGTIGPQNAMVTYIEALREKMALPDLSTCLDEGTRACTVSIRTSVWDAAKVMKQYRTTAVCVMEGVGDAHGAKMAGIFTSKDVVLRVIAAGLDPRTCSVVRVMTPHPDTAPPEVSIQSALRKMHDGHYLNLPVLRSEDGQLVGVVDVLRLTYKTLEQINSMADEAEAGSTSSDGKGGPMWNHFWNSFGSTSFTGTVPSTSGDGDSFVSHETPLDPVTPSRHGGASVDLSSDVFPHASASAVAAGARMAARVVDNHGMTTSLTHDSNSKVEGAEDVPLEKSVQDDGYFLFKFTTPTKRAHRFQGPYDNLEHVREVVALKLAGDDFFGISAGGPDSTPPDPDDFNLAYTDDEGDEVVITSDQDILDAVLLTRQQGKDRVTLHLHGGTSWSILPKESTAEPAASTVADKLPRPSSEEPEPLSVLPKVVPKAVTDPSADDFAEPEEQRSASKKRSKKGPDEDDDLIFGVLPQDLALPAAIGFLGVAVLVAVTISRPTARD